MAYYECGGPEAYKRSIVCFLSMPNVYSAGIRNCIARIIIPGYIDIASKDFTMNQGTTYDHSTLFENKLITLRIYTDGKYSSGFTVINLKLFIDTTQVHEEVYSSYGNFMFYYPFLYL